jgi:hypothetical protein
MAMLFFLNGAKCVLVSRALTAGAPWLKNLESFFGFTASRLKFLKISFKQKKALKLTTLIFRNLRGVGVRCVFPFPNQRKQNLAAARMLRYNTWKMSRFPLLPAASEVIMQPA